MTAADPEGRRRAAELGVLVVLLDSIHAAIDVAKASPHRIVAFASLVTGPVGVLVEDRVRLLSTPNLWHKAAFQAATGPRPPAAWTIGQAQGRGSVARSEEHTSHLQSLMASSYAVFCLTKRSNEHTYQLQSKQPYS